MPYVVEQLPSKCKARNSKPQLSQKSSRTKQGCPLLPLLVDRAVEELAITIRLVKEIKDI